MNQLATKVGDVGLVVTHRHPPSDDTLVFPGAGKAGVRFVVPSIVHEIVSVDIDATPEPTSRVKAPPACIRQFIRNGVLVLPDEWRDFPEALSLKGAHELVSLGNLRSVNGGLYIWDCVNLRDFGGLRMVRGPVDCQNCPRLEDIRHLEQVRGFIDLEDSRVSSLPARFQLMPLMPILRPFARLSHG